MRKQTLPKVKKSTQVSWSKKAQFRDDKGNWQDLPIADYRLSIDTIAFEAAKKGLHTRVIEFKPDGKIEVVRVFRRQQRGLK
jgi:hypothetical protein